MKYLLGIPVALFLIVGSAFATLMGPEVGGPVGTTTGRCDPVPVAALAYAKGWRGEFLVRRVAVIGAESGFCPDALGDNYPIRGLLCPSHGLNQIRSCPGTPNGLDRGPRSALIDPSVNMDIAWRLEHSLFGWLHWSTYINGRYRAYLGTALAATEGYR